MDWSKMLVTGGAFAMLAAGWNQIKIFFGYISRFVVIRATIIDASIGMALIEHLKQDWHLVPEGMATYTGVWQALKGRSIQTLIPFRVMNHTSIWCRKSSSGRYHLIFVKSSSQVIEIHAVRGFANFDELIRDSLALWEERRGDSLSQIRRDRYHLMTVMGSEKNLSAAMGSMEMNARHARTSRSESATLDSPDNASHYLGGNPNLEYDTPLMYSREQYQQTQTLDPFEPLYFSKDVLKVVEDCQQWLDSSDWYLQRSIPWRRGVLLHGPGGTGKSSLVIATARKLKIPLYQFFLGTLSDQEFISEWHNLSTPCVVLFEEFDTVFVGREPQTEHKSLSFDCVLNMLSGVSSINGVLVFITTNHISKLDPALGVSSVVQGEAEGNQVVLSTRPGRIDQVVYLGNASHDCRMHIANRCLSDWPDEIESIVEQNTALTPVQFQQLCINLALTRKRASDSADVVVHN